MSGQLDYEINKELGECYLFMGELDKAESYYIKAVASSQEQADPYMGLATIAMQRGDMDSALDHYNHAASLQESDKALTGLGLVNMNQDNHDQAFSLFCRALELNPANSIALSCLVKEAYLLEKIEESLPYLQNNLGLTSDENTRITLAGCLFSLGRVEEACSLLQESLSLNPDNDDAKALLEHIKA